MWCNNSTGSALPEGTSAPPSALLPRVEPLVTAFPASVRVTWLIRPDGNEINVVMIAACIPTLRPLFIVVFNRLRGTAYRKRPYHDSSSEQNPDSHARIRFDYQAADDPPSDIAQQEFVAVPYRAQELVLELSHEGEDIDTHDSWFEIESTRSIAPKRSGSIRQTIELGIKYDTRAQNTYEEAGMGRSYSNGFNVFWTVTLKV